MLKPLLAVLAVSMPLVSTPASEGPLRPNANGVVEEIFNPDMNYAVYGRWFSSKLGGGGYLLNVVFSESNPDIVYVHSDVGGIFRSDDSGRNWYMIHNTVEPQSLDSVRDILVDPDDPDRIVAAVGNKDTVKQGIYVSDNGGISWQKTLSCQFYGNSSTRSAGRTMVRSPIDDDTIYAGSGLEGIFVSHDGGDNWSPLGMAGYGIDNISIDRTDADRIFVCASPRQASTRPSQGAPKETYNVLGGLFLSVNGGSTWQKISDDAPKEMVQSPFDANRWYGIGRTKYVEYTDNDGQSWVIDSQGLSITPSEMPEPDWDSSYRAIAVGPDFILLGSGRGTFSVKDQANAAWTPINETRYQGEWYGSSDGWDRFGRACSSVVIDPSDPDHWFFTDWYSVYQTWDAGEHWTLTIDGIENTVIHTVVEDPSAPAYVHMGMADNGNFSSEDGADSFTRGTGMADNCKAIAISASNANIVYALGPPNTGWYANTLFVSDDGGKDFDKLPMTNFPAVSNGWHTNSLAVDANDPNKVYIAASGDITTNGPGVWASSDGGSTWTWDSAGMTGENSFFQYSIWDTGQQLARNRDGSMMAINNYNVYYRSSDSQTWQRIPRNVHNSSSQFKQVFASPTEDDVYYIAETNYGLNRIENNGQSWSRIFNQGINAMTVALDGNRIAVSIDNGGGIYVSLDAGANWQQVDNTFPQRIRLKLAFAGDRLVVGTPGNGVMYLPLTMETLDIATPAPNQSVYATGEDILFRAAHSDYYDIPTDLVWSVAGSPTDVQIADNDARETTIKFNNQGTYTVVLTGTTSDGFTTTRTHTVTVVNNPLPGRHVETNGDLTIEAENFSHRQAGAGSLSSRTWVFNAGQEDDSGHGAMTTNADTGQNAYETSNGPRMDYEVYFNTPGTYRVWARLFGTSNNSDAIHLGLNGTPKTFGHYGVSTTDRENWSWESGIYSGTYTTISIPTAGTYTINVWMREDGVWIDKLYLTRNDTVPTGQGPDESDVVRSIETSSSVTLEAENYSAIESGTGSLRNRSWVFSTGQADSSGDGAMTTNADTGLNSYETSKGPRMDYQVYFSTPGTYTLWARLFGTSNNSDAVHLGLNGSPKTFGHYGVSSTNRTTWAWASGIYSGTYTTLSIPAAGTYTINVWMREDGVWIDKLYLTRNGDTPN